jgi:endonuclease YncB( thermonuclease family)
MALDCVKKIDAGLEQIKKGLAWYYKKYQGKQTKENRMLYSAAESETRNRQVGLWVNEVPITPWEWRRR